MPLRSSKKELSLCAGCCCENSYCVKPLACCASEMHECLCCGSDCFCITCDSRFDAIPGRTCSCLPCCFICPKCACCVNVGQLYDDGDGDGKVDTHAEKKAIFGPKKDHFVCCGSCYGCCGHNCYCISPRACCVNELSYCLCLAHDCAFPCVETVPSYTFGCLGLMCCPRGCGCCPTMMNYYHNPADWDDLDARVQAQVQATHARQNPHSAHDAVSRQNNMALHDAAQQQI